MHVHVCMLLPVCKSKLTADFEQTWKGDVKLCIGVYGHTMIQTDINGENQFLILNHAQKFKKTVNM